MLVEAQKDLTHLMFLFHRSTNAAQSLFFISRSPHHSSFLSQISLFDESLALPHSVPCFRLSCIHFVRVGPFAHHICRALMYFLLVPLSVCLVCFSAIQRLLHLLCSYFLIVQSVSIRVDCCHFRPVCPCISFPIRCLSFLHTLPSVFLNPSLSLCEQTGATTLTTE